MNLQFQYSLLKHQIDSELYSKINFYLFSYIKNYKLIFVGFYTQNRKVFIYFNIRYLRLFQFYSFNQKESRVSDHYTFTVFIFFTF